MTWADIAPAFPEIFLAVAILALLVLGTVRGDRAAGLLTLLGSITLTITLGLVVWQAGDALVFNGLFIADTFATFVKLLLLVGAVGALVMGQGYITLHAPRFEYPLLVLLATLGTLLMASANDMMSLYVGLELQSLSLYILAAFKRDDVRSSEAGLKYFVLGALSSGVLLYGVTLLYGALGTTNFQAIRAAIDPQDIPALVVVGMVFVMAGLAFKVSAAPFHMWAPDVYEGAPTSVTAYFAAVPKVAAFALLVRVLAGPFGTISASWQPIVEMLAIASMAIGAFAALRQTNIKRLLAYSSIGHAGYALVGVAAGSLNGFASVLVYLTIYFIMTLGTFGIVLGLRQGGNNVEELEDLSGLAKTRPAAALVMAVMMFAMAGVPPLAGFFGKLAVFMAAIQQELYVLAVVGVLLSAVSAYYYMRIIKIMYFDEPHSTHDRVVERPLQAVTYLAAAAMVVFAFVIPSVVESAGKAAGSLLG